MKNEGMDKSLFFITLCCVCIWLIVDMAVGKNYLGKLLTTIFPFMADNDTPVVVDTEGMETGQAENAPSSSAAGTNNNTGYQTDPSAGATQYGGTRYMQK